MKSWRKPSRPVDRAVQELDEQIAQLERQQRRLETQPAPRSDQPAVKVSTFVTKMLKPTPTTVAPSYHAPKDDLFGAAATPLKDLEAEPIAFGPRAVEPDLFSGAPKAPAGPAVKDEKLVRYLGAGSLRMYKPTKAIHHRDRNRFLAWLGLAVAALWVIFVVVR